MSQVRNLRAMFEDKGDATTPDRGRSPGVSTPTPTDASGTGSPRPLSKVRTSFVAIEKDGRMGLRRNPSDESSISRRRLSNDTDAESTSTFPDKPTMASLEDAARPARRPFVAEPIPESPRQPDDPENLFSDAGAVSDKPSTNPDKHVDEEQPSPALLPAEPAAKLPASKSAKSMSTATNGKSKTDKVKENAKDGARAVAAAAKAPVSAVKKTVAKPSTISTKSTSQAPVRSPATTAPRKTEPKPATRAPERLAAKKETSATSRASAAATKPKTSAIGKPATSATTGRSITTGATKKPQPLKLGEKSDTGFIKPKPKSPTKPVALPPSLMAHTASSVSKGSAAGSVPPRQSISRQSGNLHATGRSPSRASTSTTATSAKTVRRQPSNINHSRPSVGPPPKKQTQQEIAAAKRDSSVDEGFLARMMRPTQASSSKTADKAPITPPRGSSHRSSTAERSVSSRRESSTRRVAGAHSPAPKSEKSTTQTLAPVPAVEAAPEPVLVETAEEAAPPAEEIALIQPPAEPSAQLSAETVHETANVETAEEVTALAEEADLVETPLEPTEPEPAPEPKSEPVPVDIAAETAHVETAQETIQLAQEGDLVETPVVPEEPTEEPVEAGPEPAEPSETEEADATAESLSVPEEAAPEPAADTVAEAESEQPEVKSNVEEATEEPKVSPDLIAAGDDVTASHVAPLELEPATKIATEHASPVAAEKQDEAAGEKGDSAEEKQHVVEEESEEEL